MSLEGERKPEYHGGNTHRHSENMRTPGRWKLWEVSAIFTPSVSNRTQASATAQIPGKWVLALGRSSSMLPLAKSRSKMTSCTLSIPMFNITKFFERNKKKKPLSETFLSNMFHPRIGLIIEIQFVQPIFHMKKGRFVIRTGIKR